ncbi:choline transporter-like protein 1 [Malaya genurostris]|uniref:choline transporter-like protein 1 n=1 Tax=Malaya genurostris TaxID=325434 RepID=UPI0026F3FF1E|nr:choline transporter-like protein 1 [Malaya genurostris]
MSLEVESGKIVEDSIFRKDRTCTDGIFLLIKSVYVIGLLILVCFCLPQSDVFRVINGYDDCGNVCGRNNTRNVDLPCSGESMINRKYLLLTVTLSSSEASKNCVAKCPEGDGLILFFNRCVRIRLFRMDADHIPQSFLEEIWQDLNMCYLELFWIFLLTFFSSQLMLMLLWCIPRLIVWVTMLMIVPTCSIGTCWLWFRWISSWRSDYNAENYLLYPIGASVASTVIFIWIYCMWGNLHLILEILYEASRAIRKGLFLLFIPLLTIVTLMITFTVAVCFILIIEGAGEPMLAAKRVLYVKSPLVLVTRWYNLLAFLWFCQFLIDCQHMVTAGSITAWYFTVDKSKLNSVMKRSFALLLWYHLGTVVLGSLLIAITNLFRLILRCVRCKKWCGSGKTGCCAGCCLLCLDCCFSCLDLIHRNAYVITSMQGQPFCRAGKRATNLLSMNATKFLSVNFVSGTALLMAKSFILVMVGFVGVELIQQKRELYHPHAILILMGAVVYLIAHCFMAVYEMTIDTIFLCFCKDILLNNGFDRPYYMSRNLSKFIDHDAVLEDHASASQKA